MNNHTTLRLGNASDFDALFTIYMAPSVNPYLNFAIMDQYSFEPIFEEMMRSGKLYVYENDSTVVATVIVQQLKRRANHVVTLGSLATHPDYHGKGISSKFMIEIINKLKIEGIKRIDLCAEADNPKAIRFYEKMGFKLEAVLKKYFRRENEDKYIDEHLMVLFLDEK